MAEPSRVKFDWYQTDTHVTISILSKNAEDVGVECEDDPPRLQVTFKVKGEEQTFALNLAHHVALESHKTLSAKIEVKLKKRDGIRWLSAEAKAAVPVVGDGPPKFPTSCPRATDWDRVVAEISKTEATENPEGEAALNALFQDIYMKGTDETKRAMNKSFQESGGTVLSTNWKEVEKDKITVKAPDGMEWKNWD